MKNASFGIVKTFNEDDFCAEFKAYNREDNFSLKGLRILFESLKRLASDCETNIELDVIALCCEYIENSITDIIDDYDIDITDCDSDDEKSETVEDYLQYNTYVCGSYEDNGVTYFIYQVF